MPAYCHVFLLLPSYVLKYLDSKHNYLDEILPPPKTQQHQKSKIFYFFLLICQPRSGAERNSVFQSFLSVFLTGEESEDRICCFFSHILWWK